MIGEKKIEEAATTNSAIMWQGAIRKEACFDGFIQGAQYAQREFVKSIWHNNDETPLEKNALILVHFEEYTTGTDCDYKEYFDIWRTPKNGFTEDSYNELCNNVGLPSKWCYLKDILATVNDNCDVEMKLETIMMKLPNLIVSEDNENKYTVVSRDEGYAPTLYYHDGDWHLDWVSSEGDSILDFCIGDTPNDAAKVAYNYCLEEGLIK